MRILAWAVIILSILGILMAVAGIGGSWIINNRLTEGILSLLAAIQTTLQQGEAALSQISDELQTVIDRINTIQDTAVQLGESAEENAPVIAELSRLVDEELVPRIDRVRETLRSIRESLVAINNVLITLNTLPGIELPTLTDELQSASDRLGELRQAVQEERTAIAEFRTGVVEEVVGRFIARTDTLLDRAASIKTNVDNYKGQIVRLRSGVETLQSKVPVWIDWSTAAATLVILWFVLAQAALGLASWVYLRTGKMVWQLMPSKKPTGEALEGAS